MFTIFQEGIGTAGALGTVKDFGLDKLSKFFSSFAGSATLGIATFFAMKKALEALSDAYNLSYDSAMKNTQANVDSFNTTKTEISDLESEAKQYKETLSSLGDKYEVDLSGIESVDEMITKLRQSGKLELTDETELAKIDSQNAALERQLAIKEKLANSQQKQAASDARDALGRGEQSVAQQVAQFVPGGKKRYQGQVNNVNVVDAVNENVLAIQEYENAIEKAEKAMKDLDPDSKAWKEQEENINSYNEAIEKLTEDLNTKETDLTTLLSAFSVNGEGLVALDGFEKEFKSVKDAVENLNNINLSPAEQKLAKIESFFDGSTSRNAIKDQLLEMVKNGESATDALHMMGLTLDDLGITGENNKSTFDNYFDELIDSASKAEKAINSVDGSVSGVTAAFESDNQDADWLTMAENLASAKDLYKAGKVGTDDFKTATQFMTYDTINPDASKWKYDADAYVAAWKDAQEKVKRYFDEENPLQSVTNFSNDLVDKGLAKKVGDEYTWAFDSSAQAAEKLGISVSAVETLMHSLEAYGAEWDDVMFSGDGLARYESALEGIKGIYESTDNEELKNSLANIIDESNLADFENNLDELTQDKIIKIEFEYDLAQLDNEISELELQAANSDGQNIEDNAALISKKMTRRETAEQFAIDNGMVIPVSYELSDEAISSLQEKLKDPSLTQDQKIEVQAEIENIVDLQNEMLDAFNDSGLSWDEFIKTGDFKEFDSQIEELESKVEELTGVEIDLEANDEVTPVLDRLEKREMISKKCPLYAEDEATGVIELWNLLEANPKFTELTAEDQASVVIEYWNSLTPKQQNAVMNTEMTASDAGATSIINGVDGTIESLNTNPNVKINATDSASTTILKVKDNLSLLPSSKHISIFETTYKSTVESSEASGTFKIPARANGSAYNVLNTIPAYSNGKVSLQKDEQALVNELGTEGLIRDGEFRLIPGGMHFENLKKGDIILSASQVSALMKTGKASGTARAYAQGTLISNAYASGWRLPSATTVSSESKNTTKTTNTDTTKTVQKSTKAVEKALDAIAQWFDWTAVRLDRLARNSENAEKAIDRAVGLENILKATNTAITALAKEQEAAEKGAARYLKAAQTVAKNTGLSVDLQKKVQNGTIDITKYSETTQKKIQEYQNW